MFKRDTIGVLINPYSLCIQPPVFFTFRKVSTELPQEGSSDSIKEKIERQRTKETILMGGAKDNKSKQKAKTSPYLLQTKKSSLKPSPRKPSTSRDYEDDPLVDTTTPSQTSSHAGSSQTSSPRREITRANMERVKAALFARAKTQDAIKIQRTKSQVAKTDVASYQLEEEVEKRSKDIYKLETVMNIYLREYMRDQAAGGVDPRHTSGTVQGPEQAKRKLRPPQRKEMSKLQVETHDSISNIYGKETLARKRKREEAFYKKCLQLQLETWKRMHDEWGQKKRREEKSKKHQVKQLVGK